MSDERKDRAEITFFRMFRIEMHEPRKGAWGDDVTVVTRLRLIADRKDGPAAWAEIDLPGTDYQFREGGRYTLTLAPE